MKLPDLPFTVTDWEGVEPVEHKGERGTSFWRTFNIGEIGRASCRERVCLAV